MTNRALIAILFVALAAFGCGRSPLERVAEYEALANRHDIEGLMGLYAAGARLDLGPIGVLEGKERIRGSHEYDRALATELEMESCRHEAPRVICSTVERNDWLRAAGVDEIAFTKTVFSFDGGGRIESVSAVLAPASAEALADALARFGTWAEANAAEEYALLFREDGSFAYSYESGERVLALLERWQESTTMAESGPAHHEINYIEFTVNDMTAAKAFYGAAFGWEFNDYGPDYAGIRKGEGEAGGLRLGSEVVAGGPLVILYSADLEASLAGVREAGGEISTEPFSFPGGRRFHFRDPSGNELAVWSDR